MNTMPKPPYLAFDRTTRRLRLDPHETRFVQNPYEAYAWLHGESPTFFWVDYGFWCCGGFDDVNRLLRDRRFGRQKPEGAPDSQGSAGERGHLRNFDAVEANSMLELEPPVHTRLRTLVNRAFVSRQVERLRPRVETLANDLDRCLSGRWAGRFVARLRVAAADHHHRGNARRARGNGAAIAGLVAQDGRHVYAWPHARRRACGRRGGARLCRFSARLCRAAPQGTRRRPAVAADLRAGGWPEDSARTS